MEANAARCFSVLLGVRWFSTPTDRAPSANGGARPWISRKVWLCITAYIAHISFSTSQIHEVYYPETREK